VLPLLLSQRSDLNMMQALGLLLSLRLLDLVVLLMLCVLSVLMTAAMGSVWLLALAALAVLSLLCALALIGARRLHMRAWSKKLRSMQWLSGLVFVLAQLTSLRYFGLIAVTAALWLFNLAAFFHALVELGSGMSLAQSVQAATASNVVSALPIQGFGGFGPSQLTLAGMAEFYGHAFEPALLAGLIMQACALLTAAFGVALVWVQSGLEFLLRRMRQ